MFLVQAAKSTIRSLHEIFPVYPSLNENKQCHNIIYNIMIMRGGGDCVCVQMIIHGGWGGRWGRIDDAIILVLRTIQLLYYKAWAPNLALT